VVVALVEQLPLHQVKQLQLTLVVVVAVVQATVKRV
jgi:hypothetical protein